MADFGLDSLDLLMLECEIDKTFGVNSEQMGLFERDEDIIVADVADTLEVELNN